MDASVPNPAEIPAPASYRWTPRLQRDFLENLAATGSVKIACAMVCMSTAAAYQLKQRPQGKAFALGWAAAVLIARGRLADELLDRAIWGIDEIIERDGRDAHITHIKRKRQNPSLGLAMLARLDRMADIRARAGEDMFAQIIAGDWTGFLALFDIDAQNPEAEGHAAALAVWLAARDNRANPLASLWRGTAIADQVAQFSADHAVEEDAGPSAEEASEAMTIWRDVEADEWRTNFPPPDDYVGIEEGEFGDEGYERTLDAPEEEAWEAQRAAVVAPLRAAGEVARRAFFGLPTPANDPSGGGAAADNGDAGCKSASG